MNDGDMHPIVKAMNVLGFDASTLGNHEFNYGLDYMFKVLAGADFPFVCANLTKGELAANPRDDDLLAARTVDERTTALRHIGQRDQSGPGRSRRSGGAALCGSRA